MTTGQEETEPKQETERKMTGNGTTTRNKTD